MVESPRYLSLGDVLALHRVMMERMGGQAAPVRDEGLLESALLRPQTAAYYENADLLRQAALLAVGIAQAQTFIDGNKRTAFAALYAFLRVNGCTYQGEELELAYQIEALATRTDSLEAVTIRLEDWLRERVHDARLPRARDTR